MSRNADKSEKTLIVTGAGNGLGEAIARAAAVAGWRVGVLDRDLQAAQSVASSITQGAVGLQADISDELSLQKALDQFAQETGTTAPDGLVCNAGIVRFGPLLDAEIEDFRAVVDVNLTGTFITARAVASRMIAAAQGGSIVTVTSMNGVAPGPNSGAYGPTKAAVALLTQQMALEWGPHGIRANAIAPGLINAGMSEPIYADDEVRKRRESSVPLRRLGSAEEVAAATLFLLSDDASYISGTQLLVDGGVTMSVIASLPRPLSVDSVGDNSLPSASTQAPGASAGQRGRK
ncbi:MAG: SDR family NAD(P)-dependent oxidoreductase [Microthrixaceae bacterium]